MIQFLPLAVDISCKFAVCGDFEGICGIALEIACGINLSFDIKAYFFSVICEKVEIIEGIEFII